MSRWFEAKPKDLSLSTDGKELHIYLESDDSGAIYSSISLEVLQTLLPEIHVHCFNRKDPDRCSSCCTCGASIRPYRNYAPKP